jgi:hypothetical protein
MCDDLAAAATAVAGGDWSLLTRTEEPTSISRSIALGRRLIPPAALIAAALAMPHIPGVSVAGPAMTSIQVALIIAAVLGLASVDGPSQDRILSAFGDASKRGPS